MHARNRNWPGLGLLGGTALFGYLGCQNPDPVSARPDGQVPKDSVPAANTVRDLALAPLPAAMEGSLAPLQVGGDCVPVADPYKNKTCILDGTLVECKDGKWTAITSYRYAPGYYCNQGSAFVNVAGMLGFVGIDKAGPRPVADFSLRRFT